MDITKYGLIHFIIIVFALIKVMEVIGLSCPRNNEEWRKRGEDILNCVPDVNGTYHCILTTNGSTVELCMGATLIDPKEDGCPVVQFIGNRAFLTRPFVRCKVSSTNCPKIDHRLYYTDQLYEYPECIGLNETDDTARTTGCPCTTMTTTTTITTIKTKTTILTSTSGVEKRCPNCTVMPMVQDPCSKSIETATLVFVVLQILFLCLIFRKNISSCIKDMKGLICKTNEEDIENVSFGKLPPPTHNPNLAKKNCTESICSQLRQHIFDFISRTMHAVTELVKVLSLNQL